MYNRIMIEKKIKGYYAYYLHKKVTYSPWKILAYGTRME
jgi:hypothetical protein